MKRYIQSAEGLSSKQRIKIAQNSIDPKELSRLSYDNSDLVKLSVLRNENTPEPVKQRLAKELSNSSREECRKASAELTTDPQILSKLADDEDWHIRAIVANRTDDSRLLAKLAEDENRWVRRQVASNTDDPQMLAKLADDEDEDVRSSVAYNTEDPQMLAKLADDEDWNVRVAVADRTKDPQILAKLSDDEDEDVRMLVAQKTDDPRILAKLAQDPELKVRRAATSNRHYNKPESDKRKKKPSTDWSIPLYSIQNYSQIEDEIDNVIHSALNQYAQRYFQGSADVNIPEGAYDNDGQINITFHGSDGDVETSVDALELLGPATSQNLKKNCIKSTLAWLESNLEI